MIEWIKLVWEALRLEFHGLRWNTEVCRTGKEGKCTIYFLFLSCRKNRSEARGKTPNFI
jgi:hypothetical protein